MIVSADRRTERRAARCPDMPSNVIADVKYDREDERLTVTFVSGRIFEYVDVPAEVAASFQSAFSKGTFFNGYVRDRYDFREISPHASQTVPPGTGRDRKTAARPSSSRRSSVLWRDRA
jgi:hypothetical protein